ncbi:MAG: riboflavin synthase [Treponema sp.]|nr:riboflavin synthase [Treponema sp.]MBR6912741.1 riboflavin synthase [Treponema sp.]
MFTGIVEGIGRIEGIERGGKSLSLSVHCPFAAELENGESVAVNGTCLTVTEKSDSVFHADVTPETFRRTSLSELSVGSSVNLERAMKADGRFGGHIVSGHIDGTGRFVGAQNEENAVNVTISADKSLGRYIIEKGSVCIDGISLTVASVSYSENVVFTVAVIPHTWKNTTLSEKNSGSLVNIECDIVGKYIEHFVNFGSTSGNSENAGENSAEDSEALAEMMTNFTSFH